MSHDVYFAYPASVPLYPDQLSRNYTSNVSPMWAKALGRTLSDLVGASATNADLIEPLRRGIARMKARPARFRAMNPENGWGDYEGALAYLQWMLAMAEALPDGTCEVSW